MHDCWRTLPEDLIGEIILFVSGYQNIYKLSLCCKKFSQTFNFTLYQRFINLFSQKFGHSRTLKIFDANNIFYTHFTTSIDLYDSLNFKLLICGIRQMKHLKSLNIRTYSSFEQQDIFKKLWLERGLDLKNLHLQISKTQRELLYIMNKKAGEEKAKAEAKAKAKAKAEEEKKMLIEKYYFINGGHLFLCGVFIYFLFIYRFSFHRHWIRWE